MYIPTRAERYGKAAKLSLLLCIVVPSGIVAWLYAYNDLLFSLTAFLWPIALPLRYTGMNNVPALCISAFLQAVIFFWMARTPCLTPRGRLTFAVTWGMFFAFVLRLLIAFEIWRQIIQG